MSTPQEFKSELQTDKDESYDTSDQQAVNKAKKRAGRTKADRLKFISAAMSHPEGRAWFYDILLFCKVFQSAFDESPYRMYFLSGQKNIGLKLLDDIQTAAPEQYLLMIEEGKKVFKE